MKLYIVTPSYNQKKLLKKAILSVADQVREGLFIHHHIQDGGSRDGTVEMLSRSVKTSPGYLLSFDSSKDLGMYDAIHKGWKSASQDCDVLAWLNCDEQYLQNSLICVARYFIQHPQVDMVFGSALIVDNDGRLISYRKSYRPWWPYIVNSHLYNLSCAMFIKRGVYQDGMVMNTKYRDVGDSDFVVRCLRAGYQAKATSQFWSSFTWTGDNMSCGDNAKEEAKEMQNNSPAWVSALSVPLGVLRYAEKILSGAYYHSGNVDYALYTDDSGQKRRSFSYKKASWRWPQVSSGTKN